jgi:hypothetical protein
MAQMGIQGGDLGQLRCRYATTQFVQDIDVTFTMSGTSDNGLTFGAAIDLDENAANVGTDDAGVAIFVSGDFGTLTLGDTDGALDWAMQEVDFNGAASINDNHTSHAGFNGNSGLDGHYDGQILRYDYSFGDFAVAVSVEQDDNGTALGRAANAFDFRIGAFGIPVADALVTDNAAATGDPIWASAGDTPARSVAAASASASATSGRTMGLTGLPAIRAQASSWSLRPRCSRLRVLGCAQLLADRD